MKIEQVSDYKDLIAKCYAMDQALINRWHTIAGAGLKACVDREIADLEEVSAKIYKVTENQELVGYFGKEMLLDNEVLTGFFLVPVYRNGEGRAIFWTQIEKVFKKSFFCGLYVKNIPATRFILARGGAVVRRVILRDGIATLYRIGA